MDVFELRNRIIDDYSDYIRSFLEIRDPRIENLVFSEIQQGAFWPDPLIQLNPAFEPGEPMEELVREGLLHDECLKIFRDKPSRDEDRGALRFHRHQVESFRAAGAGDNYVLTTGTGSGKSLSYIVPIVDHVLRNGSGKGIQAIIVYPMNAVANSQIGELEKFLMHGYPEGRPPVTFRRYTGQEKREDRNAIVANPPDIILTNYVMLELIMTRPFERKLVEASKDLRFLVLDELHTYRGRQGADVALLVRRVREACGAKKLLHVGTSATLSTGESWPEQQKEVAEVASRIFGDLVKPERVIGETLLRATPAVRPDDRTWLNALVERVQDPGSISALDLDSFRKDPLASWVEATLGLHEEEVSGRLVRSKPVPLRGADSAVARLASLTGLEPELCESALREVLMTGNRLRDESKRPVFAFRLHQFISKGEAVYASPEAEDRRHVTLQAQWYVPGSERTRVLLPIVFCRECGQEYYVVRRSIDGEGRAVYLPRELRETDDTDEGEAGFLHIDTTDPWPSAIDEIQKRIPDDWLEPHGDGLRVRKVRQHDLPRECFVDAAGVEGQGALRAHYVGAPFRFCMACGVSYSFHTQSDYGKLATLGTEGRSTATTVLALSTIRKLRAEAGLEKVARKLLSFTDNRQDASLQAGHFNDFVEIGLLRSALWRAVENAGKEGLRHDELTLKVFRALDLPLKLYAFNPAVEYVQKENTEKALRQVLGYYLYRDLERGWRVTSPNLEQSGLLSIGYLSLPEFCGDEKHWADRHPLLAEALPEERESVCTVLLHWMRRELAIRVDFLDPLAQESMLQASNQYLIEPWALDDGEGLCKSKTVFPCSERELERRKGRFSFLSPRGGLGRYLNRPGVFSRRNGRLQAEEVQQVLVELLELLTIPGILQRTMPPPKEGDWGGYQVDASSMVWHAGDGRIGYHDPIRIPSPPAEGHRTNAFFVDFYRSDTGDMKTVEAREHTAQVAPAVREEREEKFKTAALPILFCSPTMELGVDIAMLNVVNMRNVPPTPANYAQRSGRAGRGGQPALVLTYCSSGSPHDQYYFKRAALMVAGSVTPPRLDLTNEDLLRAHVHALWLSVAGLDLGSDLSKVLDVGSSGGSSAPSLALLPAVRESLEDSRARGMARSAALSCLGEEIRGVLGPDETPEEWVDRILDGVAKDFDQACARWRSLYRAASGQMERQFRIIRDHSRSAEDRKRAKRYLGEAHSQLELLLENGTNHDQSDFYSYRYFACEGFLPGYNFPRLPLSAYIPGRKRRGGEDDFVTRPRFLAITEFGPRAILYHEGSRYVINKVILPVEADHPTFTLRAKQCETCGYIHQLEDGPAEDLCIHCNEPLPRPMDHLFRMQSVSTRRRDRINSDEEERLRMGYEVRTGFHFADRHGRPDERTATLQAPDGSELLRMSYGHAAWIWRMNLGWKRRKRQETLGYELDTERGFWSKSNDVTSDDPDDPVSPRTERVVPFVEDSKNCLLLKPATAMKAEALISLASAIHSAIVIHFQLEDRELAAELMPHVASPTSILLYEASEGGAGVLRHLVEDPALLPVLARRGLEVCHYDPDSGKDLRRAPRAKEDCEAACYDCLLSYYNQSHHKSLDRTLVKEILLDWREGHLASSPTNRSRSEQMQALLKLCDSELERKWLRQVDELDLQLPSRGQVLIEDCQVQPDFVYDGRGYGAAVFIDGPHHDEQAQRKKDVEQRECLVDAGWHVIVFRHDEDWPSIFRKNRSIFGVMPEEPVVTVETDGFDPDLFEPEWLPLATGLAGEEDLTVRAGEDVVTDRVVGSVVMVVIVGGKEIAIVDETNADRDAVVAALDEAGRSYRLLTSRTSLQDALRAIRVENGGN